VTYLDTGCFVKLYYPEADSARVIALIQRKPICYTPLHELEFVNALQLKTFLKNATPQQAAAARSLVEGDLKSGVLVSAGRRLAQHFSGSGETGGPTHRHNWLSLVGHSSLCRRQAFVGDGIRQH
jgi:hypothetical protein